MTDPMAAIRDMFFHECEEQLAELETGLIAMERGTAEPDRINAIFRAVHSIKGGAGIFAFDALVAFAHVFETTLDQLRSGTLQAGPSELKLLLRAADVLADLVRAARDGGLVDPARTDALITEFNDLNAAPPEEQSWEITFTPHPALYAKANDPSLILRELRRIGTLETTLDSENLPDLAALDPAGAYLTWRMTLHTTAGESAIRAVFDFVEDDCALNIAPAMADFTQGGIITGDNGFSFEFFPPMEPEPEPLPPAAEEPKLPVLERRESPRDGNPTIRVDLDRVDRMIDLVGELVINEAMLSQRVLEAGITRASSVAMALEELEHLTREIQDSVMAIRAQPVRSVFQRMPRLVREVGAKTGKQVRLVTEGEGTEVDKTMIERIADPLTHLIRNAIDHGLESTEVRRAAGKPEEGLVKLIALHRSGRIVLEVSDDGAGINRPRVREKAIEKGLIAADAVLSDDEIDNLIFLPGFSTAAHISDISGRGVGMDVVRQSIISLGGRISIASQPGIGSTFTLSLPLTLAVLDGMVVAAAGHTLIIPLGAIVETLKPKVADVFPLDGEINVLRLRGGYVPMVDVAQALGYSAEFVAPADSVALLVESEGDLRAVLLVEAIHGQRQVVIKSLEANYRAVPGIAAATVMGDGRVALILDVDALVKSNRVEPVLLAAE
jgi:two-component system chemotaxis sensor kinase CheA